MIRKLNYNDIDKVMQIWVDANMSAHEFIPVNYWRKQFADVRKAIFKSEIYVYESGGIISGFIGIADNYIAGIFVETIFQSKGIGKELLDYAKTINAELSLRVYQKNKRAIQFFQREMFTIVTGEIDKNTSEDELLMRWQEK